jgi:hypothetical protein
MSEKQSEIVSKEDMLRFLAKVAEALAGSESKVANLTLELESSQKSNLYWMGEYNKATERLKKAEQRIAELEGPLAALARAGGE